MSKRKLTDPLWFSFAAIPFVLLVVLMLGWVFCREAFFEWQDSKQLGPSRTFVGMCAFVTSVQQLSQNEDIQIPQELDLIIQVLFEKDKNFSVISMSYNPPEETAKGRLIDYWRRPILLVVSSPTEYKLISYGHDGKDDKGQGDDVVVTFNPTEEGDMSSNLE